MRRAAATRLTIGDIDDDRRAVVVPEKGGLTHRYPIRRKGLRALRDYIEKERLSDADFWTESNALFLPADSKPQSHGRLHPVNINAIWNDVCKLAHVKGKTPHSARHAMGRHIMDKTKNPAAVQRQLGHSNVAYALQHARITDDELQEVLDKRDR